MASKLSTDYQNNPFMIGIDGLKLIFTNAKSVGIYTIVLSSVFFIVASILSAISAITDESDKIKADSNSLEASVSTAGDVGLFLGLFLSGLVVYYLVLLLLFGVVEHAAATVAKGEQTTLKQSFRVLMKNFPAYVWLYVLITIKVLLWSLLFIVPGIIMFNRYILSGTVFFAEGKRGDAAIQRSSQLVKGGWLTTYGGAWAWNLISQGIATLVFWPGSMAVLYRQLKDVTDHGQAKPPAHVLSWLVLLAPIAVILLFISAVVILTLLMLATGVR